MSDKLSIGSLLKEARLSQGMTLEALAKSMGTHAGTLSELEHGKHSPSWATINKYLECCGRSPLYLFCKVIRIAVFEDVGNTKVSDKEIINLYNAAIKFLEEDER